MGLDRTIAKSSGSTAGKLNAEYANDAQATESEILDWTKL
jgi:hypothetical protein